MAVTNLYPNLPGHLVEFKDGGLQLTSNTEVPSGKSLLILGTAFDGPVNEPVQIDSNTVRQLFGSEVNENGYPNGSTLTKYAKQAFKNGFTDVRCMRVTGSQAFVKIAKTSVINTELVESSVSGIIEGNAAATDIEFEHLPVVTNTIQLHTASGTAVGYTIDANTPYEPQISIAAGQVSKGASINIDYNYMVISASKGEAGYTLVDAGDGSSVANYSLGLGAGESVYATTKDALGNYLDTTGLYPVTDGVKVVDTTSGDVLVEGTDYTIVDGEIVFGGTLVIGDTVDIEFYTYTVSSASQTYTMTDADQIVTLAHTPAEGTVSVVSGGVTAMASEFVVTGNTVALKAGHFGLNDTCVISYKYEVTETTEDSMIIRSIYGGSVYKDAHVTISEYMQDGEVGRKFLFTKPESKKYNNADVPFYFTSFECPTVEHLKLALRNYDLNNVFEIVCDDDEMETKDFPTFSGTLSEGGDDGVVITPNEMFEALSGKRDTDGYLIEQGAYQILENYNVDYIYPAGIYADTKQTVNPNTTFHQELALLCAVLTYRTKMTHGFIDVKPNSNTTLVGIQKYVDKLLAYDNTHFMKDSDGNEIVDADGNKMDIGWYTSIVVGPEPVIISDTLGTYYGSPAIAYAALNAILKPESAPTNKALPGVKGMKYKFSNKQMNALVGNRMVVFKLKNEGTTTASSIPYVVDGCTAGAESSDYARLSTVKIVTDVVDQIREVADPFIGEPNTIEQRNALSALISKRLSYLMETGEIQYYEFEINATIQQVVLGECSIALTLVCPMELRKITTVVALRAAA